MQQENFMRATGMSIQEIKKSFPIQENVVYKVADGYYASTSLASKNITISGPQTEIAKIAKEVFG